MAGRAVTVGFHADTSMPGQGEIGEYLDTDTWAHYTSESAALNHAVTVVGWDDAYSKENFLEGKQPPADGAWLVKNSWGAGSEDSPNWGDWGIDEDGDGVGDGCFWLSYYDMSLVHTPETFARSDVLPHRPVRLHADRPDLDDRIRCSRAHG